MSAHHAFRPRMQSRTHALRTLAPLRFRGLSGAVADVWSVHGEKGGGGFYLAPDPRIVIFLGDTPPAMALRTHQDRPAITGVHGFYIPAGMPLWSNMDAAGDIAHLDVHLEASALQMRLSAGGVSADLSVPRMLRAAEISGGSDTDPATPDLVAIARLAAQEVCDPRRGEMMLDGLLRAGLGAIFAPDRHPPPVPAPGPAPAARGLTARQLALVERYLRAHLHRHVSVAEMARAAGLSESWFAHAFKHARNETPQRWQARIRLEAARTRMCQTSQSLAEIAHATGFADQAHLSRMFRAAHGITPSAWRKGGFQGAGTNPDSLVQDRPGLPI